MNRKSAQPSTPQPKTQRPSPQNPAHPTGMGAGWLAMALLAALLWFVAASSMASRIHLVMGYAAVPAGPPALEIFLASSANWAFTVLLSLFWMWAVWRTALIGAGASSHWQQAIGGWLVAAVVPVGANLVRAGGTELPPGYWEPLWLAGWSGLSLGVLSLGVQSLGVQGLGVQGLGVQGLGVMAWRGPTQDGLRSSPAWLSWGVVAVGAVCAASWWFLQSCEYQANFMLGFNDVGHFAQRVANTAAGRGVLVETPVLPMFWDHFNPGLLLLVPLWNLVPDVHLFFALQAISLACSALFVWGIARQLSLDRLSATAFGLAWLAQPVLGQMNLAYTYGWHPISLAIPLMLGGLWSWLSGQRLWAVVLVVGAMSMEEGVIVVVALFCAGCAVQPYLRYLGLSGELSLHEGAPRSVVWGMSSRGWGIASLLVGLAFIVVYRFSGIAEFQTGRFVALGNSAGEVLLSPVLRPSAFWGAIFRWDKLAFCLSLSLPCFIPSLLRGWRWLLPSFLPLLVLIVWDHKPATSLAFQYSSTLLPIFWLATMMGASQAPRFSSCGALGTALILSLFVGQLPYSSPTLLDVIAHTYGVEEEVAENPARRRANEADGQWLTALLSKVREEGGAVLATGRIAAHVVGNRDVETVGQYVERRDKLAELPDRQGNPLSAYRWIVIDRQERFQQSAANIQSVEEEALQRGFQITAQEHDIVVLEPYPPER
jgi:uncharacterized membrane protein